MTPRRRAILIVVLALLLIAIVVGVILYLLRARPQPAATISDDDLTTGVVEPPQAEEEFENPLILPVEAAPGRTAAQQLAELFAERYGSYSNQGDYQNLRDLLPVMTASYRQSTEAFLRTAPASSGTSYEGVTSVKISSDVRSVDTDSAVIAVTLQQQKASGGAAPTVGYRTLRMELVRVGEDWKVDAAAWEN